MTATKLAKDIMTRNVLTASDEWTLEELARFLTDSGISGAPVTNERGKLVGVVSVTDIARATGDMTSRWLPSIAPYHHDGQIDSDDLGDLVVTSDGQTMVKDIMTTVVFQVDINDTVGQVADTLVRGRIHRAFVVEAGKVVGVISALDLLRTFSE